MEIARAEDRVEVLFGDVSRAVLVTVEDLRQGNAEGRFGDRGHVGGVVAGAAVISAEPDVASEQGFPNEAPQFIRMPSLAFLFIRHECHLVPGAGRSFLGCDDLL